MSSGTSTPKTGISQDDLDHTPLTFGKYLGKTPADISESNPGYLVWAYENVSPHSRDRVCSALLYRECQNEIRENRYNEDEDANEGRY